MENNNVTKQEVLKFSAEMEEEASIKLAIAKVCDVNVTDIRIVMGGRDTISEKIKKKIITPEILYAMDKAIISILIKMDLEDACNGTTWEYEGNIQGKTRFWYYCDEGGQENGRGHQAQAALHHTQRAAQGKLQEAD